MVKNKYETYRFELMDSVPVRIDKALAGLCADLSRARLQALIAEGHVMLNGQVCAVASRKVATGDILEVAVPPPVPAAPQGEAIVLDIVYEDEHLLVINKPAGLVVHPGAGHGSGTLVNALLHHCRGDLSGIGGVERPGIVHRLDRETSGLMLAAKNDAAHQGLSAQLADRSLSRLYLALVTGVPVPLKGIITHPVGRHRTNRLKMAVTKQGRAAETAYRVRERYRDACALVECRLRTGRTHQIRVHMEAAGYPLVGDPLYGPQPTALKAGLRRAGYADEIIEKFVCFSRQALHAAEIRFTHPLSGEECAFAAPPPEDFSNLLKMLEK